MNPFPGQSPIRQLVLRSSEIRAIAALSDFLLRGSPVPTNAFFEEAGRLGRQLPWRLRFEIARFHRDRHFVGLQVKGYPVNPQLTTPAAYVGSGANLVPVSLEQAYYALLAGCLGEPIAWTTQQDGAFFNHVVPIQENEDKVISSGSAKSLDLHTEDAGLYPYLPDYLGLLCLKNLGKVPTSVATFDHRILGRGTKDVLRGARFHIGLNLAHAMSSNRARGPVFFGPRRSPQFRVNLNNQAAAPGDAEASAALDQLDAELRKNCFDVVLGEGDCFFLKNKSAAHGRRPYQPKYDGSDRWLQRLTIVRRLKDFRAIAVADQTRVFDPTLID